VSVTALSPSSTDTATAPATWITVVGNNDTWWRYEVPAKALGVKQIKIPMRTSVAELEMPNVIGTFRWLETDEGAWYPDQEGRVSIWTRPDHLRSLHAVAMQCGGQVDRIVAEVDDNYLAPPKFNLMMRRVYDETSHHSVLSAYAAFDAIIVSTPYLRDVWWKRLREFKLGKRGKGGAKHDREMPEIHVCGNHLDPADWPDISGDEYDGPPRVGWMGSESHWRDIRLAYGALHMASEMGCTVCLIGFDPEWRPEELSPADRRKADEGKRSKGFEYWHIPWVDPREYGRPSYPLDIAICPLERNEFTLGKTDCKFLEMAMSGAAVVASDVVYGKTIVHGETGLIGSSPAELARHVKTLIADEDLRARLVKNAQEYVRSERVITHPKNLNAWRDAIAC
jgi:glycosyltransferase involved in cell wall biosynthesis